MKTVEIIEGEFPLKANVWDQNSDKTIIIVGGDGDTKDSFITLVEKLIAKNIKQNIITFSFRGVEEDQIFPLHNTVSDLKEVTGWVKQNLSGKIDIVCTSAGAYSTVHVITDSNHYDLINRVIFVDPADYYIKDAQKKKFCILGMVLRVIILMII